MSLNQNIVIAITLLLVLIGQSVSASAIVMTNCDHQTANETHVSHDFVDVGQESVHVGHVMQNMSHTTQSMANNDSNNADHANMDCCDTDNECSCPHNSCHNATYLSSVAYFPNQAFPPSRYGKVKSTTTLAHQLGLYRPPNLS